jgi:2'-5' RNA ligase
MARLFFALWPDAPAREALAACGLQMAETARGRPVPAANIHLTLVFLGEVAQARIAAACRAASRVRADRFVLRLDRAGSFVRAAVAWAGCSQPPQRLFALQSALEREVVGEGFALEPRPYRPHLTLARRITAELASAPLAPVSWQVRSFVLLASERREGRYRTLAEWPLGTSDTVPPADG